ncbi:hypothetical protein TNCV_1007681 [Trichonephila clavipes]|nr:hypothetical protein TNCV_1007681 [Trichonephila clavipes]
MHDQRLCSCPRDAKASHVKKKPCEKAFPDYVYIPPLPADFPDLSHRIEAAVARITSDTSTFGMNSPINLMCAV